MSKRAIEDIKKPPRRAAFFCMLFRQLLQHPLFIDDQ